MAHIARLGRDQSHLVWDNSIPPALVVAPGDVVEVDLQDASGGQIGRDDDATAIERLDFSAVNPCTGPILVDGALPGDDLLVTVLDLATDGWGWTANIPGFGLLSDDFPQAHLRVSTVRNGVVSLLAGVDLPARPMIGTIGVAPAVAGSTPLLVPTENGGNMDIAQLGVHARLHLPVRVPGAKLSLGDAHAVQGDGEICGTGAETRCTARLRVDVVAGAGTSAPWYEHTSRAEPAEWAATTGVGPDLFTACRDAARRAVDLVARTGLAAVDAYLLLSLVGELRISEVVDAPNWVASLHVPRQYVVG